MKIKRIKKKKGEWSSQNQLTGSRGFMFVRNTDVGYMYVIIHLRELSKWWIRQRNHHSYDERALSGMLRDAHIVYHSSPSNELMSWCQDVLRSPWCVGPNNDLRHDKLWYVIESGFPLYREYICFPPLCTHDPICSPWCRGQICVVNGTIFGGYFSIMSLIHPSLLFITSYPQDPRG